MNFLKKYGKVAVFVVLAGAIAVLNSKYGWTDKLGDEGTYTMLREMVMDNFLKASLIYVALTIIGCTVLAVPGVTFAVFAGLIFGPWVGTIECLVACTLGAAGSYLIGKFFLKDTIKPLVMKNKWLKKVLFDDAGRSDIVVLMITRLVPLFPYNLQNFAYGITDIRLWPYTLYTFIFMAPGVAMFTIGTAGIMDGGNRLLYLGIALILLVMVFVLGKVIRQRFVDGGDADSAEAAFADNSTADNSACDPAED